MGYFWEEAGWEKRDRHLKKLAEMPFQRSFNITIEAPGLYIIRGPRQIGKSSLLKTLLLKGLHDKKKSFYLSCEEIESTQHLSEILKSVKDYDLVLLDEISFVPHWDRAVKHAIDSGYPKTLVITGSHAYDLKRGADLMPGRFDGGGEFSLLPMDFEEFSKARIDADFSTYDRLEELRAYFRVGGFPTAVAEGGKEGRVPRKAIETYKKWLIGDIIKLGKQEAYLTELLIQVMLTQQTPISMQTLAQKTQMGSHNTAIEYIEMLNSCFAVKTLYAIDPSTSAYQFRKNKKLYFTDPLLYWLALDLSGRKAPPNVEEVLAELVAHESLSRKYKRLGYYQSKKGEIDFYFPSEWGLEVKWAPFPKNLSKAYTESILPQKIVWTYHNFLKDFPVN